MGNGKKKIPDRWNKYSNIGTVVEGTQIIAFKVPLWFERSWNLEALAQSVPSLKHVVDLTNTDRYYKATDCEKKGWNHVKIKMEGHGKIPSEVSVEKFYSTVIAAENCGGLIGVHCTHGLNRTGYLISRYLIEKKGWEPQRAIDAFDLARGEKQERENYLEHLRSRGWERLGEDGRDRGQWLEVRSQEVKKGSGGRIKRDTSAKEKKSKKSKNREVHLEPEELPKKTKKKFKEKQKVRTDSVISSNLFDEALEVLRKKKRKKSKKEREISEDVHSPDPDSGCKDEDSKYTKKKKMKKEKTGGKRQILMEEREQEKEEKKSKKRRLSLKKSPRP